MKPRVNPAEPLHGLPVWTKQDTTGLTAAARAFDHVSDLAREAGSACAARMDEADRTGPAWCPKRLKVTFRACHDRYVDVHARGTREDPCFGCTVGAARRLAYATGHEPSGDAVEIAIEKATAKRG